MAVPQKRNPGCGFAVLGTGPGDTALHRVKLGTMIPAAPRPQHRSWPEACVIGASAGGVTALVQLLGDLSPQLPMGVIVVLHAGAQATGLARVLGTRCPLPVRTVEAGSRCEPGQVWVAPPGYHLLVERDRRFSLSVDDKVCYVRPSVDVLFASAADAWRERLIGVILTGGNEDGADGLLQIRSRGGVAVVQDPAEAEAAAMPQAALQRAGADHVLGIRHIGRLLNRLAGADTSVDDHQPG